MIRTLQFARFFQSRMDEKSICRYGANCYQQNPTHFAKFSHPGHSANNSAEETAQHKLVNLQNVFTDMIFSPAKDAKFSHAEVRCFHNYISKFFLNFNVLSMDGRLENELVVPNDVLPHSMLH